MSKNKEYLDIDHIEDVKNISAEDSIKVRDRDIKIKLTPLFCSVTSLISIAVAVGLYFIRHDIIFASQVLIMTWLLIYVSCVDIKLHMAPNWVPLVLFAIGIPWVVINCVQGNNIVWTLINAFGGMFIGFILLFVSSITSKGGIGAADIKISTALGFVLGIEAVFLGQLVGLLFALIYSLIMMGRKVLNKQSRIALLPFLSAGMICASFLPENWLL